MNNKQKKLLIKIVEEENDMNSEWVIGDHHITTTNLWADSKEHFAVFYKEDLIELLRNIKKRSKVE